MQTADEKQQIRAARGNFAAMACTFSLGAFNDNFFKTAALYLAVAAGLPDFRGYTIIAFTLPWILLAAPAGWLADRFPKRTIVIFSKALELVAMAAGAVGICTGNWWLLLAMVFLMGLQSTVFSPALLGSIPELYPPGYVIKANGYVKTIVTVSILVGIGSAGFSLGGGRGTVFGIATGQFRTAAFALGAALLGVLISFGVPSRPAAAPRRAFPWKGPLDTLRELWNIRRDRLLAVVLGADVFIWFVGQLQILILALLEREPFGFDRSTRSMLMAAETMGVAAGAVLAGRYASRRPWQAVLVPATLVLSITTFAFSAVPLLPRESWFVAMFAVLALAGVAGGMILVPCESFIQVRPAPEKKGAVIAAANCAAFIGMAVAGAVAIGLDKLAGPTESFAVIGVMSLVVCVLLAKYLPRSERA